MDFPIKNSDFSIAMLVYQRVYELYELYVPASLETREPIYFCAFLGGKR